MTNPADNYWSNFDSRVRGDLPAQRVEAQDGTKPAAQERTVTPEEQREANRASLKAQLNERDIGNLQAIAARHVHPYIRKLAKADLGKVAEAKLDLLEELNDFPADLKEEAVKVLVAEHMLALNQDSFYHEVFFSSLDGLGEVLVLDADEQKTLDESGIKGGVEQIIDRHVKGHQIAPPNQIEDPGMQLARNTAKLVTPAYKAFLDLIEGKNLNQEQKRVALELIEINFFIEAQRHQANQGF